MIPSLFICSECKEIEEDRTNVITCAECNVGSEFVVMMTPETGFCRVSPLPNPGLLIPETSPEILLVTYDSPPTSDQWAGWAPETIQRVILVH